MENSPRHSLPYIMPSQAQKHVTHNEAIRRLDALLHLSVKSASITSPPAGPNEGDSYIIAPNADGAWQGQELRVAAFQDGAWEIISPEEGYLVWIEDTSTLNVWHASAWTKVSQENWDQLGINTAADQTNRLSVASQASLFTHEGNGHQLKINKNSATDTASILFQSSYLGQSEIGLAGDNNLHIKVSPDGSTWKEALVIDASTATVSLPESGHIQYPPLFNLFEDAGRFAGSPEPIGVSAPTFTAPTYLQPYNGASFSQGPKFIHNNSNFGGTGATMATNMEDLAPILRPGATSSILRYGPEFYSLTIQAGSGTSGQLTVNGIAHYLAAISSANIVPQRATLNYWVKVENGSVAVRTDNISQTYVNGVLQSSSTLIAPADGWQQITRLISTPLSDYIGYETNLTKMYFSSNATALFALPTLYPGHLRISPNTIYGAISSLNSWR